MLTDAAFNALLKTLEEPPAHANLRAGHHRASPSAGNGSVPLPAVRLQADSAYRNRGEAPVHL